MHKNFFCLLTLFCSILSFGNLSAQEKHFRIIKSSPHSLTVRCPVGWSLMNWQDNDLACTLKIPQTKDSRFRILSHGIQCGAVTCRITTAPESLKFLQKEIRQGRYQSLKETNTLRHLSESKIVPSQVNGQKRKDELQLENKWEYFDGSGWGGFEIEVFIIRGPYLYSFAITSDEEHYAAFNLDFQEMLKTLKVDEPKTRIENQTASFWVNPKFQFGLNAPSDWTPIMREKNSVSFTMVSEPTGFYREKLAVQLTTLKHVGVEKLKELFLANYARNQNTSVVNIEVDNILGKVVMDLHLETKDEEHGMMSRLIRRVQGERSAYTIEINCLKKDLPKREDSFRRVLESFKELELKSGKTT